MLDTGWGRVLESAVMKTLDTLLKVCVLGAMLVLPSCSWCWPSLHMAETLCHQERRVVVVNTEACEKQFVWQGKTWLQVKLACATDKGRGIYRRGDMLPGCMPDTSARYEILPGSERTYYLGVDRREPEGDWELLAEADFDAATALPVAAGPEFAELQFMKLRGTPYAEVWIPVEGMPAATQPGHPAIWKQAVAVPLVVVDAAATVGMCAAEMTAGVVLVPVAALYQLIVKPLVNCHRGQG